MKTYTFQFEDGTKATYRAYTITEAMAMRCAEHGDKAWTISY